MDYKASKVDKTFDRVNAQLNDYTKVFRKGGMLEKAIDELGGDSAWLNDVRSKLDELIDTINDAHMYAMMNDDDVYGESANVQGKRLNESTGLLDANDEDGFMARSQLYFMARDAIKLHGMIGDRDELPPWLSAKITKAAEATEAVREFIEYHSAVAPVEPGAQGVGDFHNDLDNLVHDTFGPSSDEMNEAVGQYAQKFFNLVDELGAETVMGEAYAWMGGHAVADFEMHLYNQYDVEGDIEDLVEMIGMDTIVNELARYLSGDEINDFYEHVVRHYDLHESCSSKSKKKKMVGEAAGKYRVVGTTTSGEKFKSGVMDKKSADDRHYKMTKQTDKRGKKIYKKIEVVKEEQVVEQAEFDDGSKALNPQTIATNMMKAAKAQAMKKVKK